MTTAGAAVSNAIATVPKQHPVEKYREDFATVLPTHVNAKQWTRLTVGQFRTNPTLERILQNNPGSVLTALMDCAQKGLVLGDTYHLLPFGNAVTGTPDYTGLIELMYRAGEVASVKVEIVYEGDEFVYYPGEMDRPQHRPDWFADKRSERPMIGVYAYGVMHDGSVSQVVIMDKAAVEKVMRTSKTWDKKDSMWQQWPDRAWRKTAIRQLAKWVPTDVERRRNGQPAPARPDPSPVALEALGGAIPPPLHDADIHDAELVEDVMEPRPGPDETDIDLPATLPVDAEIVKDEPAEQAADEPPAPKAPMRLNRGEQAKLRQWLNSYGYDTAPKMSGVIEELIGVKAQNLGVLTMAEGTAIIQGLQAKHPEVGQQQAATPEQAEPPQ